MALRSDYVPPVRSLRQPRSLGVRLMSATRPAARPKPPYEDRTEPPLTGNWDPTWGKVNPPMPSQTDMKDFSPSTPQSRAASAAASARTAAELAKVLVRRRALMRMYTRIVPQQFGSEFNSAGGRYGSGWDNLGDQGSPTRWFDTTTNQVVGYSDLPDPTTQANGSTYLDIHRVKPFSPQLNRFYK